MTELRARKAEPVKARVRERTIVLVDDHPVVRRGLVEAISGYRDLKVVAEASGVEGGMQAVAEHMPDLAILDISLSDGGGLELTRKIHETYSGVRILLLSMHDEGLYAERALRAGASGYVEKTRSAEELVEAIRTVLSGGTSLSPKMTDRLVHQAVTTSAEEPSGVESLSNRELEVFQLIGHGKPTREIADSLCISIKTVETHRENIKKKLDIGSASELTRFAVAWVENPA